MSVPAWLGLVGLGRRAGSVIVGTAGVRAALKRGEVALVVLAADASSRTGEKVERLARGRAVPVVSGPEAKVLGHAVGGAAVQAIGVTDPKLAAGIAAKDAGLRRSE